MGAIQDTLDKWADKTVKIIQTNLSATGTDASGQTSRSVRSEPSPNRATVTGRGFIFVVETGRRPGKRPPVSKIQEWLESGKVNIEGTIERAAFAISKAIGEKGTKLFQQGGREDIITPAISDQRIDELTSDIADIELKKTLKVIDNGIGKG